MLNPEGDIENIYREFAKNYPLKTDDSGWDEFLQKMEGTAVNPPAPEKPIGGNPVAGIVKKYSYWLTAAALVIIIGSVLLVSSKYNGNHVAAAKTNLDKNKVAVNNGSKQQPYVTATDLKHADSATSKHPDGHSAKKELATGFVQSGEAENAQANQKKVEIETSQPTTELQKLKTNEIAINKPVQVATQNQPITVKAHDTKPRNKSSAIKQAEGFTQKVNELTGKASLKPAVGVLVKPDVGISQQQKGRIRVRPNIAYEGQKTVDGHLLQNNSTNNHPNSTTAIEKNVAGKYTATTANSLGFKGNTTKNKQADSRNVGITVTPAADTTAAIAQEGGEIAQISLAKSDNPHQNKIDTAISPFSLGAKGDTTQNSQKANDSTNSGSSLAVGPKTVDPQSKSSAKVQPLVKISTREDKRFYVGLVAGPDFSSVKLQGVKHTGSNIGVGLGMYLGKSVSIESGIFYTHKKYFSSAAYFKTGLLLPPDLDDLKSINATANFFEVPITVRYDLIHKKWLKLFVNGGLSSYFSSHERYELLLHRPFGYETREEESEGVCSNILSLVNISAGIELKLSVHNAIRIEPYVKLPLSGIGAGSLPITSRGLFINFTHSFFK